MATEVTIVGNVSRDPGEIRYTKNGHAWFSFGMAVSQGRDQDPAWYDISVFSGQYNEKFAENTHACIAKGMRVVVSGRLGQRKYQRRDGAGEGMSVTIVADEVAPSLKYAEIPTVTKNPRDDSAGGGGYGQRGAAGGGYGAPAQSAAEDDPFMGAVASPGSGSINPDEEPF